MTQPNPYSLAMPQNSNRVVIVDGRKRRPWSLGTKDKVIAAAIKEIAAVGFERAKVGDIAKRAKVAPGTLYTWFDNKEDLFRAALESALKEQFAHNATSLEGSELKHWGLQIGELALSNQDDKGPTNAQILMIESYYAAWRDKKARRKLLAGLESHLDMYERIIRSAQEDGTLAADLDAPSMALLFMAIPTGLSMLTLAGLPRMKNESWRPFLVRFITALKP